MTPTCQGSQFSSTRTTAHLCVSSTTAIENHLAGSIRTFLSKTNSTGLPPWLYGFSLWYVCWNLPFHLKLAEGSCLAPPGTSLHGDVRPCPSTSAGSARLPPSHLHQPSRVQAGTPCWEKSPLLVHHIALLDPKGFWIGCGPWPPDLVVRGIHTRWFESDLPQRGIRHFRDFSLLNPSPFLSGRPLVVTGTSSVCCLSILSAGNITLATDLRWSRSRG